MANKRDPVTGKWHQSRRVVSLNGKLYERWQRVCKSNGTPIAAATEDLIRAVLARVKPQG